MSEDAHSGAKNKEENKAEEPTSGLLKLFFSTLGLPITISGAVFAYAKNAGWSESAYIAGILIAVIIGFLLRPFIKHLSPRYDTLVEGGVRNFDLRVARFRRHYLEYLWFRHRDLDLKGLSTDAPINLSLKNVFVDLGMVVQNPDTANSGAIPPPSRMSYSLENGRHSVWDYLRPDKRGMAHHLVIIGAPGSGKTTLLKHLVLCFALKDSSLPKGMRRRLPIILFLRDHINSICPREHNGKGKPKINPTFDLPKAVEESLKNKCPREAPHDWFAQQLAAGQCVVMLDGLDEVADPEVRRLVVDWVDAQKSAYGKNPFLVTSRPMGYQNNRLSGVYVLEVMPFTPQQQVSFIHNWYREEENKRRPNEKEDEGVRMKAREGAEDLLKRIEKIPALTELAVNPLLLTMITTVHHYRNSLPENRVKLYAEICDVFLGKHRAARGIIDDFTPAQKQTVLQPLAYVMMQSRIRDIPQQDAEVAISNELNRVSRRFAPSEFLALIESGSGLLIERENSVYSFAHLTFQEFLAAVHIQECKLEAQLSEVVADSWWHETMRLYCARTDATPIVSACLAHRSAGALALALECEEEALKLNDDIRDELLEIAFTWGEDEDVSKRHVAADALLQRRLRRMRPLDENRWADTTQNCLVTNVEYQLFVDEMKGKGKDYRPLHWQRSERFPINKGREPVLGVLPGDADDFCKWLSQRSAETGRSVRIPHHRELEASDASVGGVGYWVDNSEESFRSIVWSYESLTGYSRISSNLAPLLYLASAIYPFLSQTVISDAELARELLNALSFSIDHLRNGAQKIEFDEDRALLRVLMNSLGDAKNSASDSELSNLINNIHNQITVIMPIIQSVDIKLDDVIEGIAFAYDSNLTTDRARSIGTRLIHIAALVNNLITALDSDRNRDLYRNSAENKESDRAYDLARSAARQLTGEIGRVTKQVQSLGGVPDQDLDHEVYRVLDRLFISATALTSVLATACTPDANRARDRAFTNTLTSALTTVFTDPRGSTFFLHERIDVILACLSNLVLVFSKDEFLSIHVKMFNVKMLRQSGQVAPQEGLRMVQERIIGA